MPTRIRRLKDLWRQNGHDLVEAVRAITHATTSAMAQDLGLPRQSVEQCLRGRGGRKYDGIRRAIEAHLRVPPFSLDPMIDHDPPTTAQETG